MSWNLFSAFFSVIPMYCCSSGTGRKLQKRNANIYEVITTNQRIKNGSFVFFGSAIDYSLMIAKIYSGKGIMTKKLYAQWDFAANAQNSRAHWKIVKSEAKMHYFVTILQHKVNRQLLIRLFIYEKLFFSLNMWQIIFLLSELFGVPLYKN